MNYASMTGNKSSEGANAQKHGRDRDNEECLVSRDAHIEEWEVPEQSKTFS